MNFAENFEIASRMIEFGITEDFDMNDESLELSEGISFDEDTDTGLPF